MTFTDWLSKMEELETKATSGPWISTRGRKWGQLDRVVGESDWGPITMWLPSNPNTIYSGQLQTTFENADFIAASRTFIPQAIKIMKHYRDAFQVIIECELANEPAHALTTKLAREALALNPEEK